MVDQHYQELMHKAVDGATTPEETQELESYLSADATAREQYEHLRKVVAALAGAERFDAPRSLKGNVMACLAMDAARAAQRSVAHGSLWASMIEKFRIRPAIPFVVGVAVGALLLLPLIGTIGDQSPVDRSQMSGTLILNGFGTEAEVIDSREFAAGTVHGRIATQRSAGLVLAEIELSAPESEVDLRVHFDFREMVFLGVATVDKPPIHLSSSASDMHIRDSGQNRYRLAFTDAPGTQSEITLQVAADDRIWEGSVRTRR
jgi:hypothetical protein